MGSLDDILVCSPDMEICLHQLQIIFERLGETNLILKEGKCNFFKNTCTVIKVSGHGIQGYIHGWKIRKCKRNGTSKESQENEIIAWTSGILPEVNCTVYWYSKTINNTNKKRDDLWLDSIISGSIYNTERIFGERTYCKYPDPSKTYTVFIDVRKYAWACVPTETYTHEVDGTVIMVQHPITSRSGLFRGTQLNWTALKKEVYTTLIY